MESGAPVERSVFLNSEGGTGVDRPVLDSIKRTSEVQGISLAEALDSYVAQAASAARPTAESQPDGPVDTPDVMVDDLTAGQLEDIRTMASDEGIPLADAIEQYGWQDKFSDIAESLPAPVELVTNRGFSEADLADAQQVAHANALAQNDVADAISFYDVQEGEVKVQIELNSPAAKATSRLMGVQEAVRQDASDNAGVRVSVEVVKDASLDQQDAYIRGGGYLSVGCTAGFNLKEISGDTKRLGTAGHCTTGGGSQTYSNHSTHGGSTSVSNVWTHQGSSGDLGYTSRGNKTSTRTFYQSTNSTRYADDRGTMPAVGTSICKFGRTSGKTCSTVSIRNATVGSLQHMVVMRGGNCRPGDSGGPWYNGGTAYGIHSGVLNDGTGRCVFTPAYLFQNRGYDVWTR
ncbi:S1 family peptidase [Streptomyces niveiscabiei]|uniref:S1 family peptidase n=1 Tax=Streptomyces niveiscabiei TaxID=164115 RepID=UPI0029B4C341|nr:S1 family peptidase [Streptomyces niveiscabiei]MDX3387305.1 S1 family peptidase [Streptomyces niveiscabiei]